MNQDEFNRAILAELRELAKEVYRSTQSHFWDDLGGILTRLDRLQNHLPIKS